MMRLLLKVCPSDSEDQQLYEGGQLSDDGVEVFEMNEDE